ncbi:phage shock protein A (PspA) family protein [Thermanaeromonas toyohensis ToBE]|uniref:Phage shock protein A (PspA) family protein n=1 Tax=Thermanaeromonas toyohensis ToBE TaxID=698762 RepID=A0A1W1VUQ7_9FIRM|nr:PspA/IM30 family protein [Thermanaeromonas toyohensis]SMB97088.1 phage shock protein A (PspA) family protein [Thermanaeromonas toyohensis ToBE]
MEWFKKLKSLLRKGLQVPAPQEEEPKEVIDLYLKKAAEKLKILNLRINEAVAEELRLRQKLEACRTEVDSWSKQAKAAITRGRDDMARIALEHKYLAERNLVEYESRLAAQQKMLQEMRETYRILEEKFNRLQAEKERLLGHIQAAQAVKEAAEALEGTVLDFLEDKWLQAAAEAEAAKFLATRQIPSNQAIEDELGRLKMQTVNVETGKRE